MQKRIKVINSHTGGEPTRIIIEGGPDLGNGPLADRVTIFRDRFDEIRSAVVNEPRGSDVLVGGLLCEPTDSKFVAGIIYFDSAGYLGMCGHGTIGLMVTLKHLGKIQNGSYEIETPVGPVMASIGDKGEVSVQNIPSYRTQKDVTIDVEGYGTVIGDVAWGGNWFFLVKNSTEDLSLKNADQLTRVTKQIREALKSNGITGTDGPVDHVELFSSPQDSNNDSRNFVLCPGGAYDRSPCGTGTSAKLACLAADGVLAPGKIWRQESILGSVFAGSYQTQPDSDAIIPTIRGTAFICGESDLILDENDSFCMGIRQ
jgi:4-hydroxyproline epimerase